MLKEKLKYYVIVNDGGSVKMTIFSKKPELKRWIDINQSKKFKIIKGYEIVPKLVERLVV